MPRESRAGVRPPQPRTLRQAAASRKTKKWTLGDGTVVEVGQLSLLHYLEFENEVGAPLDEFFADVRKHLIEAANRAQESGEENVGAALQSGILTKMVRVACFILAARADELSWRDVAAEINLVDMLTLDSAGDLPLLRLFQDAALLPAPDEEAAKEESPTSAAAGTGAKKQGGGGTRKAKR